MLYKYVYLFVLDLNDDMLIIVGGVVVGGIVLVIVIVVVVIFLRRYIKIGMFLYILYFILL